MTARKDIIPGEKFNRLTVIRELETTSKIYGKQKYPKYTRWVEALCECGSVKKYNISEVRRGHAKSCGCLSIEIATARAVSMAKHGMNNSPEYVVWVQMRQRCFNPRHHAYADYGGRGVTVCERWADSFENFYADVGPRPKGKSLDRYPDTNGHYEPCNVRWATQREQCNNKRNNVIVCFEGKTQTIVEWARELQVKPGALYARARKGMSPKEILGQG
jgi:hypothetical protein